jgi:hypothetical protein
MMSDERPWTDDLRILWQHPLDFYPVKETWQGRMNALTRLVVYASILISLFKKSIFPLIVGLVLTVLVAVVFWRKQRREVYITERTSPSCRKPTRDNPMMNTPTNEFGQNKKQACLYADEDADKIVKDYIYQDTEDIYANEYASRPFITLPNGGTHPDFSALAESLMPTHS